MFVRLLLYKFSIGPISRLNIIPRYLKHLTIKRFLDFSCVFSESLLPRIKPQHIT